MGACSSNLPPDSPSQLRTQLVRALVNAAVVVFLLLGVLALVSLWSDASLKLHFDPRLVLLLVVTSVAFLAWTVFCWHQLLKRFAGASIAYRHCLQQVAMALLGKYVPGKVWGIVVRAVAARELGVGASVVVSASVLEQLLVSLAAVAVAVVAVAAIQSTPLGLVALLLAPVAIAAGAILAGSLASAPLLRSLAARIKLGWIEIDPRPGTALYLAVLYLANWGVLFVVLGVLSVAVDSAFGLSQWLLVCGAYAIAVTAGFAALFAPGGIGVREGVFVALLAPEIGVEEALALGIVFRLWNVAFDVGAGVLATLTMLAGLRK